MLEFSKKILSKVSFDRNLFQKELQKSARWMNKRDMMLLKIWALTSFSQYKDIILEVFDNLA
ncbi:MAG: hypothetical protein HOA52_05240 [Flavobacteriales bacterium]|nr:hypothetical protein [Flavobacteriales bacterium]MBT6808873.1 hypothetical protein [Flavobacteriales bacterium]